MNIARQEYEFARQEAQTKKVARSQARCFDRVGTGRHQISLEQTKDRSGYLGCRADKGRLSGSAEMSDIIGHNTRDEHRSKPPVDHPAMPSLDFGDLSIAVLAIGIQEINHRAIEEYAPLVEGILRTDNRDVRQIEHTLDGLLT
jgi:hypothetical protein